MGSETLPSACYIFPTNLVYPFTLRTRRVKGYTRFVAKYVTGRRKRFRPHEYIFVIRITSRVDLVCPSVRPRMNAEISETLRARLLRFGVQIPESGSLAESI